MHGRGHDHPVAVRRNAVWIHDVGLVLADLALAGLDDLDHLVGLRIEHADRAAVGLVDAGAGEECDEHVRLAVDRVPDDVLADLLTAGVETVDALDDRRAARVAGQPDLGEAATWIEARGIQTAAGAVIQVVQRRVVARELEVLEDLAEVGRFRVQLDDRDAVPGAEGRQAAQQHDALGFLGVTILRNRGLLAFGLRGGSTLLGTARGLARTGGREGEQRNRTEHEDTHSRGVFHGLPLRAVRGDESLGTPAASTCGHIYPDREA